MKDKKTEKKKIKISSRIVYIISLLLVSLSIGAIVVFAINTISTGYKVEDYIYNRLIIPPAVPPSAIQYCAWIDNNNCPGTAIFIPTKTSAEWVAFKNNYPSSCLDVCQDDDSYISQTGWFPSLNACGSLDYNCDGELTKRYTVYTGSQAHTCLFNFECDQGWGSSAGGVPECGDPNHYLLYSGSCLFFACSWHARQQQCH